MSNLNIGVIVGSLRKASFNRQLAHALVGLLPAEHAAKLIEIGDLPLYNQDLDGNLPETVQRFKAEVAGVDALLFVTPEYNRGMPGVLKNAIDWGSRPYGQGVWGGKRAAIAGASPGAIGTALAQAQLRNVLSAVGVQILPLPEVFFHYAGEPFDAQGGVVEARTRQFLQGFVDRFVQWAGEARA
ncbi:NAD(P)H-dependent oxidoreductase [Ralstonia solanacearum]|uniref:NAD(P)H-dependent oxidoreductase n=2 Tax=Ralstonia solanacearum TaxID=305 RepID=A0AAW5ZIH3_RALSL|nr:NADPH-dependent FMN reductase [Ralstonia solanacearum]MBB6592810.1 NAD(P)H-dependent oxidoreductase [Ralstonia solanacearum]MBB6597032.1 NAD(P)H-dependent oxidoreductase [Ralstonia solanacearum]MDB0526791.1 NAD(P)H-dependent oxidoreductase [Ralstonia solanacearum]MDB0542826.1 NAD(P)H-dependent oxidoreductase [Ralstonia solanacearum]MDB0550829.1 NAD(P)H-dependent oxidoreductase [Ralstonia solanacearum]